VPRNNSIISGFSVADVVSDSVICGFTLGRHRSPRPGHAEVRVLIICKPLGRADE
jgi:hypothetical protein